MIALDPPPPSPILGEGGTEKVPWKIGRMTLGYTESPYEEAPESFAAYMETHSLWEGLQPGTSRLSYSHSCHCSHVAIVA